MIWTYRERECRIHSHECRTHIYMNMTLVTDYVYACETHYSPLAWPRWATDVEKRWRHIQHVVVVVVVARLNCFAYAIRVVCCAHSTFFRQKEKMPCLQHAAIRRSVCTYIHSCTFIFVFYSHLFCYVRLLFVHFIEFVHSKTSDAVYEKRQHIDVFLTVIVHRNAQIDSYFFFCCRFSKELFSHLLHLIRTNLDTSYWMHKCVE